MAHRLITWLGWIAIAIAAGLLVMFSLNRKEQDIRRFTGDSLPAHVRVNNETVDTAVVIRTGTGAYIVKFLAKEYFVERNSEGWQVGTWIVAAANEGHTPGPPHMALVFPPDARTGDWQPKLVVEADRRSKPARIDFHLIDGRRIRIDL